MEDSPRRAARGTRIDLDRNVLTLLMVQRVDLFLVNMTRRQATNCFLATFNLDTASWESRQQDGNVNVAESCHAVMRTGQGSRMGQCLSECNSRN
jgi:hypothetical protein